MGQGPLTLGPDAGSLCVGGPGVTPRFGACPHDGEWRAGGLSRLVSSAMQATGCGYPGSGCLDGGQPDGTALGNGALAGVNGTLPPIGGIFCPVSI